MLRFRNTLSPFVWAGRLLLPFLLYSGLLAGDFPHPTHRVSLEAVRNAMQQEVDKGYNVLVSTTSTRFTSAVIFTLVDSAVARPADSLPLLLHYDDWCEAFRLANQLDSGALPEFVALQRQYQQSQYVEFDTSPDQIKVKRGSRPNRILRVTAGWPDTGAAASEYSFIDSASSPRMQATNERLISYWLLQFDHMVMQDEVSGLKGRPLDGALGTIFKVIGNGRAVQSRFAVSDDGIQITRARAKKGFLSVNPTSTTYPDGRVEKGTPENRADLKAIAEQLKQKIKLEYPDD